MHALILAGLLAFSTAALADPTEHTEAELLLAVQAYAPERFERLMQLKDRDPEQYMAALETIEDLMLQKDARQSDRRAQLLSMRERKLSLLAAYDAARSDRERAAVQADLEALALEHLQLKQELQQRRLEAARLRLEHMEAALEAQGQGLEETARQQVEALLKER